MERWAMGKVNLAARRGAKANRRKAIVAQKRKAEAIGGTLAGQVARAAAAPIRCCLLSERLFDNGMGTLILARGDAFGQCVVAGFLLDTFGLGVKDVMFRPIETGKLASYVDLLGSATPMVTIEPSYARKLLRDLVMWSGSRGLQPHPDFAAVERLFGDVDPQLCEDAFEFGHGGKPLYVADLSEIPPLVGGRTDQLSAELQPGDFDYGVSVEEAVE
jgi:hypothetical protein